MPYFQVNDRCTGCLACVQSCPAAALDHRDEGQERTILHNMARCARCATCLRVCPERAVEFQHLIRGGWDEVVRLGLVRCAECGRVLHTTGLARSIDAGIVDGEEPLCPVHRARTHGRRLLGATTRGGTS